MTYFTIKEKLDARLYTMYNIYSDIKFKLDGNAGRTLQSNEKYKKLHQGEQCFIIGTGPSINTLSDREVDCLAKHKTIAVNSMYKASRLKSIVPNYYALLDNNYWGRSSNSFLEIGNRYKENSPIFITDLRAKEIASKNGEAIYVYAKNYPDKLMRFDLKGNISATMNVVGTSILTALYMGFTEIYLLGCDYNSFCESTGAHCYDDAEEINTLPTYNLAFYLKYYALTTEFHYLIASTAKQMGVKIINISNKSLLDAYPRKRSIDYLQ